MQAPVFQSVTRLWRHPRFRRLLLLRVITQAADGCLQVGLASYVLLSPYQQPDGWSIAMVLAITLLPFSVLGPFVGIVIDRWSRRQILLVGDLVRVGLALTISALVATGDRSGPVQLAIMAVALIALSLNRFVMATISAALPHTIEPQEYLSANTIMPLVGPLGVLIGGAVVLGLRSSVGQVWQTYQADALGFVVSATGFAVASFLASRFARPELGPDHEHHRSAREVLVGLQAAVRHLAHRRPAGIGLVTIGLQRVLWGIAMVGTILIYRNHFHAVDQVAAATRDLALWAGATTAGFLLASALTPPMAARYGVRRWMVVLCLAATVFQAVPGSILRPVTLVAASFLLGLVAQSFKICTDTLVQAHIEDTYKGRVFVLYDMIFNGAQVVAAVIAAAILPPEGASLVVFVGLAVGYGVLGLWFVATSGRIGTERFDRGTESARIRA